MIRGFNSRQTIPVPIRHLLRHPHNAGQYIYLCRRFACRSFLGYFTRSKYSYLIRILLIITGLVKTITLFIITYTKYSTLTVKRTLNI
jgi:hypothetical protein